MLESIKNLLKTLLKRSKYAMEVMDKTNGQMAIVEFLNENALLEVCEKTENVYLSCINSANQFSISGEVVKMNQALKQLQEKGARVTPLFFSPPFHSPLMKEAAEKFAVDVKNIRFEKQQIPVVSNVTGKLYEDGKEAGIYLTEQLTKPAQ